MRFTKSHWLAATSVLALMLPAATAHATKHPKYGGTLRLELSAASISLDPRTWKPGSVVTADSEKLAALIYDRLIILDDYGRFQPALATEWSHDNVSKSWQFKLRSGVKFSDGSLLSPRDVVTTLQPLLPSGLQILANESGIQIRAARATPDLLEQVASGRYFVYRVQADNVPIGTGPFVVAEGFTALEANLSAGKLAHLKLRAREDAWSGRPFVDSIDVTLGNTPLRQILDLQVGRADVIDIPPDLVHKARQDNLRIWNSRPETLLALRFDSSQRGTGDPNVRQALELALDRDTMANVLLQRQALPALALLPQWLSGYAFLFESPMDLERARSIRATLPANTVGANEPLRLRIDATGDLMKLLGERVAVNARQANISMQLLSHTASGSTGAAGSSSAIGLHLFAWHYDSLSPRAELQALAQHLHAETGGDAESSEEPLNPEKLYAQERRLLDERQILPLLLLPEYVGIAPSVRNWSADPCGAWRLADVWVEPAESVASRPEAGNSRSTASGVHP